MGIKHTKGPWEYDAEYVWVESFGAYVAAVGTAADGYLIAASPELLEALQWFVDNDNTDDQPYNQFWLDGLNKARAAIAKALGEQANG